YRRLRAGLHRVRHSAAGCHRLGLDHQGTKSGRNTSGGCSRRVAPLPPLSIPKWDHDNPKKKDSARWGGVLLLWSLVVVRPAFPFRAAGPPAALPVRFRPLLLAAL